MDFLRTHHDAVLMGANTLREEPGPNLKGADFGIDDDKLRAYREETLGLAKQKIIVVTGSGNVALSLPVFHSQRVEPWILTTTEGERSLRSEHRMIGGEGIINVISVGTANWVDLAIAVQRLRQQLGIRTLLCEGGPTLYGQLLTEQLIDEEFRTISLQVLGETTKPGIERPTTYGNVSYLPETAPWFRLISIHYALPYHAFFRLRYEGPRKSPE